MQTPISPALPAGSRNSLALRLWHWGSVALISALLTTILFLRVIIKTRELGPEFQAVLQGEGVTMSVEQVRELSRIVSHRIWDWHIYLGVALAFLLLFRIVLEFFQPAGQRFGAKLGVARQYFRQVGADLQDARHSLVVKYSYVAFYLMLTVMVLTGLLLIYADDVPAINKLEHDIKEIHGFTMYLVMAFIVAHVAGVVWSELTKGKGIVSDMINGGRRP